jgi:hypothetical protein
MRAMRKLLLALAIALPLHAQLEKPAVLKLPGMDAVDVRKNVLYDGTHKLDLCRPKGDAVLPLVIYVNGVGRRDVKEWGRAGWPPSRTSRAATTSSRRWRTCSST